ncbi:MBL fold metallo-hydrolase [Nonomuraea sp. NPDC049725]|uniref:MBL fold metallo-hydrolase n=1 Tax=Nonomuraea sp. NPDC049725 TaxID=3154508 RepID=UPI00343193DC
MTGVHRRTFLWGAVAAGAGALLPSAALPAAAHAGASPGGAITSRSVGAFDVVALRDSADTFPATRTEMFPDATEEDWRRARRADPGAFGPGLAWKLDFRCYAVRRPGGRIALVDAGVGPAGSPGSAWAAPGVLPELLAAARIDVADVDLVVLTHVHEDHMGWSVSTDGVPTFPNARYVVQRTEVARLAATSPMRDYLIVPLQRTGQLREIDGEVRLAGARGSRLTAIPTPGHTVGHQSVLVDGHGRRMVITGDVLVHAVQLVAPDVGYALEADQAVAAETRRALLADARRRRATLATAHLTSPFVNARHP